MATKRPATTVRLGDGDYPVRVSYPHVFTPHAMKEGQPLKYSCSFLIDKRDKKTIAMIETAIRAAVEKGKTEKWKGKVPKTLKTPLRDGDEERDGAEYEGMMFINANSNDRPQVVDRQVNPITDPSDFYPGCYCRATINMFPFDTAGNKGIGAGLMNLQKVADGENLTGRTKAEDDFDPLEDEETPFDTDDEYDFI